MSTQSNTTQPLKMKAQEKKNVLTWKDAHDIFPDFERS